MIAQLLLSIVKTIVNLIELLFIARIALKFFNADAGVNLVALVYQWTDALLGPVARIFPSTPNIGFGIDSAAVVGLVFYAIVYFIINKLFRLFFIAG